MSEKKRPDEIVRERLEGARDKVVVKVGAKRLKRLINTAKYAVLLILLLVAASLFFRVNVIDVSGDVTMFNEGDVIRAARLSEGDLLFGRTSGSIRRTIKKNMPLCESVKVKKSLSGKVSIEIEFADVHFYTKIGDTYYAIDKYLRVTDSDVSRSKYSAGGAICVRLPELREPNLGEKLVFYDTVEETDTEGEPLYEVRKESYYSFATEFLSLLSDSGYLSETQAVVLDEKFDIELVYANKFLVKFGDSRDLDVKFRLLFEILADGSINYASRGVIDLSDPSMAYARADESLDLSSYID